MIKGYKISHSMVEHMPIQQLE